MADENEDVLDLEKIDGDIENKNRVEKRIKDLSEKVRTTSEERDEKDKLLAQAQVEKESLQKERDFLNSFGDTIAKYPKATQFRDEIKEKVLKGYSVEDATVATLASKGELSAPPREVKIDNPAGGSATVNQPAIEGQKTPAQMSREEKRSALLEAEQKGEIYIS